MRAATATKPKKIDAYRKEPSVNKKYLPYSYHLNDYVISMENGDLMAFSSWMAAHMTAHQIGNWSPGIKTLIRWSRASEQTM
nr:hypothetical protein [Klebsiella pneumoniae]